MLSGAICYSDNFKAGLKPDTTMTVTQWANAYRMLPKKSSSEPGRYRSSRTPYLTEIMDSLTSSSVQEICFMKSTQIGATEMINNWIFYIIDKAPGPILCILPTQDLAQQHSRQKLQPSIDDTPQLKGKIKEARARDSGNTLMSKEFTGGVLFLAGSNSAAALRSKSIRYLALDDVDGFEFDVGGEGDPCELAKRRTDTFGSRKKIIEISTPTTKGVSRIERSFLESDQRFYHVPCPHCGEYQRLQWGGLGAEYGIKFKRDESGRIESVWYECFFCHKRIEEHHKTEMLNRGRWIPTEPDRTKRGYQLSSLYSPIGWVSWPQIVKEFLEAKEYKERLKTFVNTRLGETFDDSGEQPDWSLLKNRCEQYRMMEVPKAGLVLTAGIDTQDDRLAVVIRAWGRGEESFLIFWGELFGDPGQPYVWDELDSLLARPFPHSDGYDLHVISAAVDSGGHHSQDVYNFARKKTPQVIAIKGMSQPGKPVIGKPSLCDVTWQGKLIPNSVQLWPVGADTAKGILYSRLKITNSGPGCYHWPIETPDEYFIQLTAEKLVTRYVKGFPRQDWILPTHKRNEALDCEVYAYAAAIRIGIHRLDFDAIEQGYTTPSAQAKPHSGRRVIHRGYDDPYSTGRMNA